ncbi:MAG: hypothetical protein U9O98_11475 [Asgard group archaeon]|nr:hypothetical protein [Asgard group archaeon]
MPDENSEKIGREEIKQYLKDLKNGTRKEKAIAAYMLGTVGKKK